jgi:hypothetical protein
MSKKTMRIGSRGPYLHDDKGGTEATIQAGGFITQQGGQRIPNIVVSDKDPVGARPEYTLWLKVKNE